MRPGQCRTDKDERLVVHVEDLPPAEHAQYAEAEFRREREIEALDLLGWPDGFGETQAALRQICPALEALGCVMMLPDDGGRYAINSRSDAEKHPSYIPRDTMRTWNSLRSRRVGFGTLVHFARDAVLGIGSGRFNDDPVSPQTPACVVAPDAALARAAMKALQATHALVIPDLDPLLVRLDRTDLDLALDGLSDALVAARCRLFVGRTGVVAAPLAFLDVRSHKIVDLQWRGDRLRPFTISASRLALDLVFRVATPMRRSRPLARDDYDVQFEPCAFPAKWATVFLESQRCERLPTLGNQSYMPYSPEAMAHTSADWVPFADDLIERIQLPAPAPLVVHPASHLSGSERDGSTQ